MPSTNRFDVATATELATRAAAAATVPQQCDLMQALSRHLKGERDASHPERHIGLAAPRQGACSGNGGEASNDSTAEPASVDALSEALTALCTSAATTAKPDHWRFFYLQLLLDVLKAAGAHRQQAVGRALGALGASDLRGWLATHSCCVKVTDLACGVLERANDDPAVPPADGAAGEEWVAHATALIVAATRHCTTHLQQPPTPLPQAPPGPLAAFKFIDDAVSGETLVRCLAALFAALNGLLKRDAVEHARLLGETALTALHAVPGGVGAFIRALSGNDEELVRTVLCVTEVELRLASHTRAPPTATAPTDPTNPTSLDSPHDAHLAPLLTAFRAAGLAGETAFVLFLHAVAFDADVLVDFLASPETPCLALLLRASKSVLSLVATDKTRDDDDEDDDDDDDEDDEEGGDDENDYNDDADDGDDDDDVDHASSSAAFSAVCARAAALIQASAPPGTREEAALPPPAPPAPAQAQVQARARTVVWLERQHTVTLADTAHVPPPFVPAPAAGGRTVAPSSWSWAPAAACDPPSRAPHACVHPNASVSVTPRELYGRTVTCLAALRDRLKASDRARSKSARHAATATATTALPFSAALLVDRLTLIVAHLTRPRPRPRPRPGLA